MAWSQTPAFATLRFPGPAETGRGRCDNGVFGGADRNVWPTAVSNAGGSPSEQAMAKQLLILLIVAAAGGGAYFFWNYEFQTHYENGKLAYIKVSPKAARSAAGPDESPLNPAAAARPTFRIATMNLGRLDENKLANRRVADVLLRLLPRFELTAVQGVRGKNQGVLVRLVEQLNAATGRTFDFATCPTQQRDGVEHYSAFLFDRARIEVDRTTVHFVEDRGNRFRTKPLVGSFRARGPNPAEAFTFTLINVETDPDHAAAELDVLADVFRAVREDGRNEDDIILLGDLESDDSPPRPPGHSAGRHAAVFGRADHGPRYAAVGQHPARPPRHQRVHRPGGSGRHDAGVRADRARRAWKFPNTCPIWAEFSVYEGGQPGHAGTVPAR